MEISKPTDFKRGVHIAIDQENGVLKGELISDNLLIRFLHNKLYLMIIMIVDWLYLEIPWTCWKW